MYQNKKKTGSGFPPISEENTPNFRQTDFIWGIDK